MEIVTHVYESATTHIAQGVPSNDKRPKPLSRGRSPLPADARIYRPTRAVTTSGKARDRGWRLAFEQRTAPFIEPLMGYTGGGDTLTQVELSFPTLEAAIRYAERQGLTYVIQPPSGERKNNLNQRGSETWADKGSAHAFSDATLDRLGLSDLQDSYGKHSTALRTATAHRVLQTGPHSWLWSAIRR